jgi:hypothetical protein
MSEAMVLVRALRDPASVAALDSAGWTSLLTIARAEQLLGTLAHRVEGVAAPAAVNAILSDARINAAYQRRSALWEADCAARALADYPGKVVLMKGTAYVAAGLKAGQGRHIGDLDIMVAREDLGAVEALLLTKGGWEWVKEDAYDDAYYRDHMHELPPLIHKERDRMIDVHHTILPLTARPKPDAAAMLADAKPMAINPFVSSAVETQRGNLTNLPPLDFARGERGSLSRGERESSICVFSPTDMAVHCAAHLFADGDMSGGLRNLWDFHCLVTEFASADPNYYLALQTRAQHHQLWGAVHLAARLAWDLYGTEIPQGWQIWGNADSLYRRRLLVRNGWGTQSRQFTRLAFYIRSHLLRMPPMMLARHLWTKWRKG